MKATAGGLDRPHPAGIAVFTGDLRESMIVIARKDDNVEVRLSEVGASRPPLKPSHAIAQESSVTA